MQADLGLVAVPFENAAGQHRMQGIGTEQGAADRNAGIVERGAEAGENLAFGQARKRGLGDLADGAGEGGGIHGASI